LLQYFQKYSSSPDSVGGGGGDGGDGIGVGLSKGGTQHLTIVGFVMQRQQLFVIYNIEKNISTYKFL